MNIFKFFSSIWHKIQFIANLVYTYVTPIYKELVIIIKEVQTTDFEDDEARHEVFQRITDFIQSNGLKKIPDSILNLLIEVVFQLVKKAKD